MKRGNHSKSHGSKALVLILAFILIMGAAIGTTLAWFTDTTDPVVNTFTVGNIDIELKENTTEYKMIPGHTIAKDPVVTVKGGSEDCWLFIKVTKTDASVPQPSANPKTVPFDSYISYKVIEGEDAWQPLEGHDGVYYRAVPASDADKPFQILADNKVTVKTDVTKAMMDELNADGVTLPKLTFTAYACQYYSTNGVKFDLDLAWHTASGEPADPVTP